MEMKRAELGAHHENIVKMSNIEKKKKTLLRKTRNDSRKIREDSLERFLDFFTIP